MKWLVIGGKFDPLRYEILSDYLNSNGLPNEMETLNVEERPSALEAMLEAKDKYDQIRLERSYGEKISRQLTHVSSLVKSIGSADAYVQKDGTWWPHNMLYEAFVRLAADRLKHLDLESGVFIVGAGGAARAAVAAFLKLGFQRINLTDRHTEKLQSFVTEMRKRFFNADIHYTEADRLTLMPGNHQVVINTTPLVASNHLLEELYYFNYMKKGGIVIDMTLVPAKTPLIVEAESVAAQAIPGYILAAWTDLVWVESCLPGAKISLKNYAEFLLEKLPSSSVIEGVNESSESSAAEPPSD